NVKAAGRPESEPIRVDLNVVGSQYFDVMKMPIVLGRRLNLRDSEVSRKVAVINETMARTHFPVGSPLGRTFGVGADAEWQNIEVAGVVKDAKYMELEERQMPAAFFPYAQHGQEFFSSFVVRYTGEPTSIVPAIRRAIGEIDANLPVGDVRTLTQ